MTSLSQNIAVVAFLKALRLVCFGNTIFCILNSLQRAGEFFYF
ncbi:MAG: hypothetical protein PHN26_03410 [Eubacteriaceae bacterium]|nr:hypothetical protein [Eubacteriaceae bacterium]